MKRSAQESQQQEDGGGPSSGPQRPLKHSCKRRRVKDSKEPGAQWEYLPQEILLHIFQYLPLLDRAYASQVAGLELSFAAGHCSSLDLLFVNFSSSRIFTTTNTMIRRSSCAKVNPVFPKTVKHNLKNNVASPSSVYLFARDIDRYVVMQQLYPALPFPLQVCRGWNQAFHMPELWRCFEFELNQPASSYLRATHPDLIKQIIKRHANHLQYVSFKVDHVDAPVRLALVTERHPVALPEPIAGH